jgi:hypothetical protein
LVPLLPMGKVEVFFDGTFTEPRLRHPEGTSLKTHMRSIVKSLFGRYRRKSSPGKRATNGGTDLNRVR